jgi:hypothetical protein
MAYPKSRFAAATSAVCAVAALVCSSAQSVLKATPTPPAARTCPTGYQGTPPNCVKKPQWDVKQNKPS